MCSNGRLVSRYYEITSSQFLAHHYSVAVGSTQRKLTHPPRFVTNRFYDYCATRAYFVKIRLSIFNNEVSKIGMISQIGRWCCSGTLTRHDSCLIPHIHPPAWITNFSDLEAKHISIKPHGRVKTGNGQDKHRSSNHGFCIRLMPGSEMAGTECRLAQ